MTTSSTTLALGTSAGTLAVTACSALIMGALAMYTLLHHRQVFAWMRKIRKKDEESAELNKPAEWIDDLYKAQCGLAQKPCRAADFDEVTRIGNMIKGIAEDTDAIRVELSEVVKCVGIYTGTALPDPGPSLKVSLVEHHILLVRAMKQEAARWELERAINATQKKIKALRNS
ncbi:hypothetical protein [Streptomyces sp. NPDC058295]|jgi:hypothetical protein|uniref:hypothetical protein n=1 Tax=Streptomyces sp. NPDC058295 TaxID=3346431 RepID=UPI0036E31B89